MDAGPFESHIAELPVMPPGLTPAELVFATTTPKQVNSLYSDSLSYTHKLYAEHRQAIARAHAVDQEYFGNVEELNGAAATAVSDRLVASVKAGETVSAEYLNALHGYDAQTAATRYMETTSDGDVYLAEIETAEAITHIISNAIDSEGDLQSAIARSQDGPNKLRTAAIMIGGSSVLVAVQSGIFVGTSLQRETNESVAFTSVEKDTGSEADVWAVVGGIGLTGAVLAGALFAKAKSLPHWRARRKLKRLQATGPSSEA